MTRSAHVDRFCEAHLPPPEQLPEFRFDLPELQFPEQINCATELLDRWVDQGAGYRLCIQGAGVRWTYADLQAQANRIARVLVDDMGLVPGNRVLLRGANSPMLAACWFGVVKAGAVAVGSMPLLRARELVEMANKAQISHALCDGALAEELALARPQCPTLVDVLHFHSDAPDGLEARAAIKAPHFDNVNTAADDTCLMAFTSGTTGAPKGTMHFHRDVMAACACWPKHVLRASRDDVFIGSPPLAFTFGLGGLLLFPLSIGASTVLLPKATPELLPGAIAQYRANVCFTSPTAYRAMAGNVAGHDLASLRKCVSAGEALPAATRQAWKDATGIEMIDGIGSTELLHIFISHTEAEAKPGATGKPVPGYSAAILDDELRPVLPGQVGRLAIKGPTGCRYLADERQRHYVQNGWNLTGDAYRVDDEGCFVYQARTDDMIISGGYNIAGPEIESVLLLHPAVAECGVIGVADEERGQIVKAFVVPRAGHAPTPALARELQDFVKESIAPYKYPRAIEFRSTLPRTETGKLQRFRLRRETATGAEPAQAVVRPLGGRVRSTVAVDAAMQILQPPGWAAPRGYVNGVAAQGTHVFVAGQIGWNARCEFETDDLVGQVRQALANIVAVLAEAGARPEHITRMTWYLTDKREYIARGREIGAAFRERIGVYHAAMSAVQVSALIEDRAKVEIEATAVLPVGWT